MDLNFIHLVLLENRGIKLLKNEISLQLKLDQK